MFLWKGKLHGSVWLGEQDLQPGFTGCVFKWDVKAYRESKSGAAHPGAARAQTCHTSRLPLLCSLVSRQVILLVSVEGGEQKSLLGPAVPS